ncbi:MAG: ribonuclease HII [bacterium]|nr:MAG: ribonuclease HII [bacterium]
MSVGSRVAGVDEAGRGPLAGPVVAAAVILSSENKNNIKPPYPLRDSKVLSPQRRERIYEWLKSSGAAIGVGVVLHDEIDRINILRASLLAMKKAVYRIRPLPEMLLIDGIFTLDVNMPQKAIVKGDSKVEVISAASIAAKVIRDRIMKSYHGIYPRYGFDRHKGYPTRAHKNAILLHGPSPIHRMTFKGVKPV